VIWRWVAGTLPAAVLIAGVPVAAHAADRDTTVLVSVSKTGGVGKRTSAEPAISGNGRYVAFASHASNLVPGDINNRMDVFVRDLATGVTRIASLGAGGVQGNFRSTQPAISADGRYVAFTSDATNLVPGDTNGWPDVFVRDTLAGTTTRVSVSTTGVQADHDSAAPAISADGRYVAFVSGATTLVPGDTNGTSDVFVHDTVTGTTERVSIGAPTFADSPDLSADGRYVSYVSGTDVFVRDRTAGVTTWVSEGANGTCTQSTISADGRYVVFVSEATNLVPTDPEPGPDVLIRDLVTGTTRKVSDRTDPRPGSYAAEPDVSATGRFVAFVMTTADGGLHIYRRDLVTGITRLVSVAPDGTPGNLPSADPSISATGGRVAFTSAATNLTAGDTNGFEDIFVYGRALT
jgi:Tol biopolymer transport system component